jgi:hypothetical protein
VYIYRSYFVYCSANKYMMPNLEAQNELISAFRRTLESLPSLAVAEVRHHVHLGGGNSRLEADAILRIDASGKPITLLVETKSTVYPRDARQTVWQLRELQKALSESEGLNDVLLVLISNSLSEGAKDFLRDESIGYFEEGGSLFLAKGDLYILLERPSSKKVARATGAIFSGRRSQVLLALLQAPRSWISVKELSDKAFVSTATASQVLADLEKREWVLSRGSGPHKERQVQDPRSLLDAWSKHVVQSPRPRATRYFVPSLKPEELMQRINQLCKDRGVTYAITAEWAAQIYSPFLSSISQVRCRFPNDQPMKLLADELHAREVTEGSNFEVIETKAPGYLLFSEEQRGIRLASPIVVYLDLLQSGGRAKEMAEHLRRERIAF